MTTQTKQKTTITLPDAQTMLTRLQSMSSERDFLVHFYPHLIKGAGKTYDPAGFVMLIFMAISTAASAVPAIGGALRLRACDVITALVDNEDAVHVAKALCEATNRTPRFA